MARSQSRKLVRPQGLRGSSPRPSARSMVKCKYAPVAQWTERRTADAKVGGSSPLGRTSIDYQLKGNLQQPPICCKVIADCQEK